MALYWARRCRRNSSVTPELQSVPVSVKRMIEYLLKKNLGEMKEKDGQVSLQLRLNPPILVESDI